MKTKPSLFTILAFMLIHLGSVTLAENSLSPTINESAVRRPMLPAPAWLLSLKPELSGMAEIRDRALFEAFDFNSLPPDEYPLWRERWKSKCYAENENQFDWCSEQLANLVRLRDEETINFLFSQLEQGQGRSFDAAEILGESGQEWLIPRLEKALFLKPEEEPKDDNPGDVRFGKISEYTYGAFTKIIEKSHVLSPRLKSWIKLVCGPSRISEFPAETDAMIRKWWDLNRERMAAGDYRKLRILPLWPGDNAGEGEMDVPFSFPDYVAATQSRDLRIRRAAIGTLEEQKMATWLSDEDAALIGENLKSENSEERGAAHRLLEAAGVNGTKVLAEEFANRPEMWPGANLEKLLDARPDSAADRARYVAAMVSGAGKSYLSKHRSLNVEVFPLLKKAVFDESLSDDVRASAAGYLSGFASARDIPVFELLLQPSYPRNVREWAVNFIIRFSPPGATPAALLAFENDPALGDKIKMNVAKRVAPRTKTAKDPFDDGRVDDHDLTESFFELFKNDVNILQRNYDAYLLAKIGEQGITLLKLALTMNNDAARGCSAAALLGKGVGSQEEQEKYLESLVIGLGEEDSPVSDFLFTRDDLHAKALPLLKQRVLGNRIPGLKRDFAARLAAAFATKEDVPFFESLLATNFPGPLRSTALHAVYRLLPPAEVPDTLKALINDRDLGEVMRIYHYAVQ